MDSCINIFCQPSASFSASLSFVTPATAVLVGQWLFDEGSGSTAFDSSPNANNGAENNTTYVTGIEDTCLSYNGSNTYVAVPSSGVFDFGADTFSVSFWFNANAPTVAYPAMLTNNPGGFSNGAFAIRFGNGGTDAVTVHWVGNTFSGDPLISSGVLTTSTWYHVVVIRNGATVSLYINGVLVGTGTGDTASTIDLGNGGNLLFGGNSWDSNASYYNGLIDQMRIYGGVLTQAQITALYNTP